MLDINSYIESGIDSIKGNIGEFFIYCFKSLANFVITTSDITCPIICLLALAFYIGGNRKSGKYISGSIITYFLLQALKGFVAK